MKNKMTILTIIAVLLAFVLVFYFNQKAEAPVVEPLVKDKDVIIKDELPAQEGLPVAVEAKRQAIYQAALSGDYDRLAAEAGDNFNYSFGGEFEGGFAGYLKLAEENEGRSAFEIIPTLLKLPYAQNGNLYTWPSVFSTEPANWTAEDIAMMKTFLTDEQIEEFRQFGAYVYYRIGITSDGDWTFYVAGD